MKKTLPFILGLLLGLAAVTLIFMFAHSETADPKIQVRRIAKEHFKRLHDSDRPRADADLAGVDLSLAVPNSKAELPLSVEEFEELADSAVNAYQELKSGELQWQATVLHLSDLAYLAEERLACASQYAMDLNSVCHGSIELVLDPRAEANSGEVVYARSTATIDSNGDKAVDADACSAYVDCLANIRVGTYVPLPSDVMDGGMVALRQETLYTWASPVLFDARKVEELIALRQNDLETGMRDGKISEFDRASEERLIAYLQRHLSRLSDGAK